AATWGVLSDLPAARSSRRWRRISNVCNQIVLACGVCNAAPSWRGRSLWFRHRLDPRPMAGGLQELNKIVAGDRGGHGVAQRMAVDDGMAHQRKVEHHGDTLGCVVHGRERGDGAGLDTERLTHLLGRAERKATRRAEPAMQRLELDGGVLE